jgi:hypothetical protein
MSCKVFPLPEDGGWLTKVVGGPYFKVYGPAKAGIKDGLSLFSERSRPEPNPNSHLLMTGFMLYSLYLRLSKTEVRWSVTYNS